MVVVEGDRLDRALNGPEVDPRLVEHLRLPRTRLQPLPAFDPKDPRPWLRPLLVGLGLIGLVVSMGVLLALGGPGGGPAASTGRGLGLGEPTTPTSSPLLPTPTLPTVPSGPTAVPHLPA